MVRCTLAAFILEDRRKKRAQIKRSKKKERKLNDAMCAHLWVLYVIAEPCAQKNIVFGTPLEFITGEITPELFSLMSIQPKRKHLQCKFNFGPSLLKGLSPKPSGDCIPYGEEK